MKIAPKIGSTHQKRFTVDDSHLVDFSLEGMPPVLATPWLIWSLEHAAYELMQPLLDDGETTVGVQVDIEHLAPTPPGHEVTCTARVVHADGPLVSFQVEAHDGTEPNAKGVHKRCVVKIDRFASRVEKKKASRNPN